MASQAWAEAEAEAGGGGRFATALEWLTFADYLRLEEDSPVKHEFLGGQVWAMAGGSPEHAAIAANVCAALIGQLRDRPCRVYNSDLRIRVRATGLCTYPDVTCICGRLAADPEDPKGHTALNPVAVVEVLSPSTEEYDRGEKRQHYERVESLREIVLIAHDRRQIDVWTKAESGTWTCREYAGDTIARLDTMDAQLDLHEIYRDPLEAS